MSNKFDFPEIADLVIEKELGRGRQSIVYKGKYKDLNVAVKVQHAQSQQSISDAKHFYREASFLACLNHKGLPSILDVGEASGRAYFVQEFIDGINLADRIKAALYTPQQALDLAYALASILRTVHRFNLVHRDIKPRNILVDSNNQAYLIDFGLAAKADASRIKEETAGSFLYSSPEQLGGLEREVDARSDLYSLGVVIYESLTGSAPFQSNEIAELIRLHTSQPPKAPRSLRSDLSEQFESVILKLLAKDPDDRFQTAEELLVQLQELGPTGKQLDSQQKGGKLIGRRQQFEQLQNRWAQCQKGNGSLLVISAPSGMGKTRLIRELIQQAKTTKSAILTGKCVINGNPLPFAPIREAIDSFISRANEEELSEIRKLAQNSPLLRNLTPKLRSLFDDKLETHETLTLEHFYNALADFIKAFPEKFGSLLLFIDDVQWLDEASLTLLRFIDKFVPHSNILVVTARRSDEPLVPGFSELHITDSVELNAFTESETSELISEVLGGKKVSENLVTQIQNRSAGVPFSIIEYARALLDAGSLLPRWGTWQIKDGGLDQIDLPKDVIKLVLRRLDDLSEAATRFLMYAGLWGARFPGPLIYKASQLSNRSYQDVVSELLAANLIENIEEAEFAFVHDKIQEAICESISNEQTQHFHKDIAEAILADKNEDNIFTYELAEHLRQCQNLADGLTCIRSFEKAGIKAMREFAAADAFKFLTWASQTAETHHKSLSLKSLSMKAQAGAQIGRHTEAIKLFELVIEKESSPIERARAHFELGRIYNYRREIDRAWVHTKLGLSELRIWNNKNPLLNLFRIIGSTIKGFVFDGFDVSRFFPISEEERSRLRLAAKFNEMGGVTTYHLNDPIRFMAIVFPSIAVAARLGRRGGELAFAYAALAAGIAVVGLRGLAHHYIKKALNSALILDDPGLNVRLELYHIFVLQFTNRWVEAKQRCLEVLAKNSRYLDAQDLMNSTYGGVSNMTMLAGYQREGLAAMEQAVEYLRQTEPDPDRQSGHPFLATIIQIEASLGRTIQAKQRLEPLKKCVLSTPMDNCGNLGYYGSLLGFYYETQETSDSIDAAIEAGKPKLPFLNALCMPHFKFYFVFCAFAKLNQYLLADDKQKERYFSELLVQFKRLASATWMPSWRPILSHYNLLKAVILYHQGKVQSAHKALDKCFKLAAKYDLPWMQYEYFRFKAHFQRREANPEGAAVSAMTALNLAKHMGWSEKSKWIQTEFFQDLQTKANSANSSSTVHSSNEESKEAQLSPEAIRRRNQLDSFVTAAMGSFGILDVKDQATKLLDNAVECFGPDRALLFLQNPDGQLHYFLGRGTEGKHLEEMKDISTKAIQKALLANAPIIFHEDDAKGALSSDSFIAHKLRSVLVAPLLVRGKPIGVLYLDNRMVKGLFRESDKVFINSVASVLAAAIESARATQLEIEKQGMKRDLELTGAVQRLLLPSSEVLHNQNFHLQGFLRPAAQSGGDWWWAEALPDGSILSFVGDVTGHGPPSAMVTASVAGAFQLFKEFTLFSCEANYEKYIIEINKFLDVLDKNLLVQTKGEYSMPFTAVLTHPSHGLCIWGGGMPSLILKTKSKTDTEFINPPGTPLAEGKFASKNLRLNSADLSMLLIYTDGLWEVPYKGKLRIGERFLNQLFSREDLEASTVIADLREKVQSNAETTQLSDDVTFVLIESLGTISSAQKAS